MKEKKIAILGLGYVGLPLAILFAEKYQVIGYDHDESRIIDLKNFKDKTNEISSTDLKKDRGLIFFGSNFSYNPLLLINLLSF